MSKADSQTVQKALQWLNQQDKEWIKDFQDPELAVRLYLKSQKPEKKPKKNFIIKEEMGAFLKEKESIKISKSLNFKATQHFEQKTESDSLAKNSTEAFYLDKTSFQKLEQIKEEWNLESRSSALRLLIQAGYKNLNRLKS